MPRSWRSQAPRNRGFGQPRGRRTNLVLPGAGVPATSPGLQATGTAQASQPAGAYQYYYNAAPGTSRDAAALPGSVDAARGSQEALVAGGYGDPRGPTPQDFESTMGEYSTLFFEKKLGPFQAWQLFIMWMAITGLIVYIASLVGFRHAGEVNGTCDDYTPCRGEAQCQDGRCTCLPPLFVVVRGVCKNGSRAYVVVNTEKEAETGDLPSSTVGANLERFYTELPVESALKMTPDFTNTSLQEEQPTSFVQDAASYSELVASNSNKTTQSLNNNGHRHK